MESMKLYEIWNETTGQPFVWGEMSQEEREDWAAAVILRARNEICTASKMLKGVKVLCERLDMSEHVDEIDAFLKTPKDMRVDPERGE